MNSVEEFTFVDYFAICGFENGPGGLEIERYSDPSTSGGESKPPLERSYVAQVLHCYPDSRPVRPFYSEVLALCMPKGLRFCTQKYLPPEPTFHNFVNIREDGTRVDGCALTFYEEVTNPTACEAMQLLHTMHVRELTSAQHGEEKQALLENGYHPPGHVLRTIYRLISCTVPPPLPVESYIYWLLHEVPLPPPGGTLKVTLEKEDLVCQRPGENELPFFDYPLREMFNLIGSVEKFLKIYTCMLLEHQILICSKVLQRLMLVAESLVSLAFPFRWQHVYVPILPYSQALFLEAPLPYIMGLCYEDTMPGEVLQSTACVVDVDAGRVEMPEDIPVLPDRADLLEELIIIFERFGESGQLTKVIEKGIHKLRDTFLVKSEDM